MRIRTRKKPASPPAPKAPRALFAEAAPRLVDRDVKPQNVVQGPDPGDDRIDDRSAELALVERAKRARASRVEIAREDPDEFATYVGRDKKNRPLRQEPIHERFNELADTYRRLLLWSHPESGKTTQLAILRVLRELGKNPDLRVVVLSKVYDNAEKTTRAIKEYIERSEALAEVFPELMPHGSKWEAGQFIVRRPSIGRDPSVQAVGAFGSILGSRIDLLVIDDLLDDGNTLNEGERKKLIAWLRGNSCFGRLAEGARVWFLGNAWHPKDAMHELERESGGGWHAERFPVLDDDGKPTLPSLWPMERIEEARRDMGPLEFARAHLCKARDDGESPFDEDAIERCAELGEEYDAVHALDTNELPAGAAIFIGVDPASGKKGIDAKKRTNRTAITTVLVWPEDETRQVLWVESGRWGATEIRDRMIDHAKRYPSAIFIVENNAVQSWIIDIVEEKATLAIRPFTTGANKAHPQFGVEGLAAEIDGEKWIFPAGGPALVLREIDELKAEMVYYTRGAHTGDRLMSLWFTREGARRWLRSFGDDDGDEGGAGVTVLG